jgi:hypothetical protein
VSKKECTIGEFGKLSSKSSKLIYKEDYEEDEVTTVKKRASGKKVRELTKAFYQKETGIIMDSSDEKHLEIIIKRLQTFATNRVGSKVCDECIVDCFVNLITKPPNFFKDKVLNTYIRLWKNVITNKVVERALQSVIQKHYGETIEDSFI